MVSAEGINSQDGTAESLLQYIPVLFEGVCAEGTVVFETSVADTEDFPRARPPVHGHFAQQIPPSSFHTTCSQAQRSFSKPHITEISTFYTSILISCSEH